MMRHKIVKDIDLAKLYFPESLVKRLAKQIKKNKPETKHQTNLDLISKALGFYHFQDLKHNNGLLHLDSARKTSESKHFDYISNLEKQSFKDIVLYFERVIFVKK